MCKLKDAVTIKDDDGNLTDEAKNLSKDEKLDLMIEMLNEERGDLATIKQTVSR